ncbi:DUF3343 domain-containing protein [Desulfovibrio sp. MES5]|uniref:DUF3343 domain-containing protein n=1 Tax=Desulfovibrio sp. MES5 TaxID=1899016 RepID=UPI0025C65AB5|nr:DUF3343 domain-containing protein [Desulfovibrio sp. MES5]
MDNMPNTNNKPSGGLLGKMGSLLRGWRDKNAPPVPERNTGPAGAGKALSDRGLLVFSHTGEVIKAEGLLRQAGLAVEVKGPPPQLRTGCDMVVVFELVSQAAVLEVLNKAGIRPENVVTAHDVLLEPVSLFQVKRLDHWLMVRAANMKITLDTRDGRIVNISGGGCPDVPWLAHCLCGMRLDEAPEPRSLGQTLCCYSLQKAYEELRRQYPCGI